jgi:thioredoxin-dependent peroxiredoxin
MRTLPALLAAAALACVSLPAAHAADAQVEVGKPAPPIDLPAANVGKALPGKDDAKTLSLADLKGKNVVLYFFPKAMTPGCTRQSCGFRDLSKEFARYDTVVVGISTDRLAAQNQFTEKESLNFPLLADADKKVAKEYGVLGDRGVARRATFVIDKQGIVRKIYPSANADKNPQEVLDYVKTHLEKK